MKVKKKKLGCLLKKDSWSGVTYDRGELQALSAENLV